MGLPELDEVESGPRGEWLQETRTRHRPIDDVATAANWWNFEKAAEPEEDDEWAEPWDDDEAESEAEDDDELDEGDLEPQVPYRAPPKVGRNAPCPCGSGRGRRSAVESSGSSAARVVSRVVCYAESAIVDSSRDRSSCNVSIDARQFPCVRTRHAHCS